MADITSNLTNYWKFESGGATTDSVGGATLTANGAPTYGNGFVGGGAVFNGSNQWYDTSAMSAYQSATVWTVAFWIKSSAALSTNKFAVIFTGNSGITGICPFDTKSGNTGPRIYHNSSIVLDIITGSPTADGLWHHICWTADSGLFTVYLDGLSIGSDSGNAALSSSITSFAIGGRAANAGQRLSCTIDEVRLYTRALTAQDVVALYGWGGDAVPNVRFF